MTRSRTPMLDDRDRKYLEQYLGTLFVSCLPALAQQFQLFRRSFEGGSNPDFASTRKEVLTSLRHVATIAKHGNCVELDDAVKGAAGVVRGWYLPWYVTRLIGAPGSQGMDPALMNRATPREIEQAARAAMRDPRLAKSAPRGRLLDLAVYKLIATVRMAYELHTGKRASDARASRFLQALGIVAANVGWPVTDDALREHARNVLRDTSHKNDRRFDPYFWIARIEASASNYPPATQPDL